MTVPNVHDRETMLHDLGLDLTEAAALLEEAQGFADELHVAGEMPDERHTELEVVADKVRDLSSWVNRQRSD